MFQRYGENSPLQQGGSRDEMVRFSLFSPILHLAELPAGLPSTSSQTNGVRASSFSPRRGRGQSPTGSFSYRGRSASSSSRGSRASSVSSTGYSSVSSLRYYHRGRSPRPTGSQAGTSRSSSRESESRSRSADSSPAPSECSLDSSATRSSGRERRPPDRFGHFVRF